ncbi:phage terminase large subunit [Bacillus sp. FJAT-49870]|uniref:Phage terminase large subunit n=2 Tax=Lederbergia citri TaxID=2833580 RepID=A0A942TF84_9BACI|nr:phage terminase large subunit [Lederbergia citri]
MPGDILADYFDKARELERLERIHRCENDAYEFALEYFSDARNPGNDGNWDGFDIESKADAPDFHLEMTEIIDDVSEVNTNAKVAIAAPRSHAKSTWFTKDAPIKEVCYRKRRYIIIISETPSVATANMEWIRNQLKFNRKLREDFGPLLSPKDQSNIKDNGEEFIAWHPEEGGGKKQLALVQAASTGQALRGRNWNGTRPDLIICDDLEDARPGGNASTSEQRSKLLSWFAQTVMPLGDPKGRRTAFVVVGTTVHRESLLMNLLHKRSDFKSLIYRAIIEQPRRQDLWEKCRLIYIDRDNPNRAEDARRFYETNYESMNEGSHVLWPEVQPLWKLMTWKWDNGSLAFNTEYMNNPIDEESMVFNPELFTYYDRPIDYLNGNYDVSMGVDFALGKQRGDYSAIVVVAKERSTGVKYVIEAWGDRIKPDEFMKVIVEKVLEYQPTVIAAESQAAQEFFVDELKKALTRVGYPAGTRVKKIYQRSRKELRIEAMLPAIESKELQFNRNHALLLEQFEQYGTGAHDDVIDGLEMAVSAVSESDVVVRTVRVQNRR